MREICDLGVLTKRWRTTAAPRLQIVCFRNLEQFFAGEAALTAAVPHLIVMCPETTPITWLVPWHPIADGRSDDRAAKELYSELCKDHVLFGVKARPVAHRQDCDDFLFELLDGSGRLAVVHLTYAQHPEPNPRWPETVIYRDWSAFVQTMKEDAADWIT